MESTQRIKLSKSDAYRLIEDYFSSGELPSVFYRRVGLSDNQFYCWRKKYLRDHPALAKKSGVDLTVKTPRNASYMLFAKEKPSVSDKGFARVEVSDSEPAATPTAAISTNPSLAYELCYPNGVVLRLPVGTTASLKMSDELRHLRRMMFGRKSERFIAEDPAQLSLSTPSNNLA